MNARHETLSFIVYCLMLSFIVYCVTALGGCGHGATPGGASPAVAASTPIDESRFVPIGGIEQWITIKGKRRDNPVILIVHGGPGDPLSPFSDHMFGSWTESFTLVQWDQRGAGRTYGKTGPSIGSTMTIERMVQDGGEVAQFLTQHLHRKSVIALGASWGSFLGVLMVKARPELYCAYVGTAQLVNMNRNLAASYPRVLEGARAAGDTKLVDKLTAIGPPPYKELQRAVTVLQGARTLEPRTPASVFLGMSPEYATDKDEADRQASENLSIMSLFGSTLSGPAMSIDLPALGPRFEMPIYFIQGELDLKSTPDLAKAYLDRIDAPHKQFVLVPGGGHESLFTLPDVFLKVLNEQVRQHCRG